MSEKFHVLSSIWAGRMQFDGKKVASDPRRGILAVGGERGGLVALRWTERASSRDEMVESVPQSDEMIYLTGSAVLEKVEAAKAGNVYVLKQANSEARTFFWIQEPESFSDKIQDMNKYLLFTHFDLAEDINEDINDSEDFYAADDSPVSRPTNAPMEAWGADTAADGTGSFTQEELLAFVQRMVALQGGQFSEEDLAGLEGLEVLDMDEQQNNEFDRSKMVGIEDILTNDVLKGLVTEGDLTEFQELVPTGHTLIDTVTSPQMQAALRNLNEAIYSDELDLLFTSLQLDDSVGMETRHPLKAFCLALLKKHHSTN